MNDSNLIIRINSIDTKKAFHLLDREILNLNNFKLERKFMFA